MQYAARSRLLDTALLLKSVFIYRRFEVVENFPCNTFLNLDCGIDPIIQTVPRFTDIIHIVLQACIEQIYFRGALLILIPSKTGSKAKCEYYFMTLVAQRLALWTLNEGVMNSIAGTTNTWKLTFLN